MSEAAITITAPGMAPVSLTEEQLKKAAARAGKGKSMTDNKSLRGDVKEGHNSGQLDPTTREKLRQMAAKIERLEEEKKEVADEIKAVYAEAKAIGFDTKALRKAIRERKKDRSEREADQMILDLYMEVLD